MIRAFEYPDTRRLNPNKYSELLDIRFIFRDETFGKHTLVDEQGNVHCIIVFHNYWRDNYQAFFLMSENFPPLLARELKTFIDNAIMDCGVDRIQTDSVADPALDKWHEFLGFTCEGTREKMIHDLDYRMWAKLRGRDF